MVISYFKRLSDVFFEIESGRLPSTREKLELDSLRVKSELIIGPAETRLLESYVNEDIVKTLTAQQKGGQELLTNWILVFDWNSASFVTWDVVSRDPNDAVKHYARYEKEFPASDHFEVVLIGSSDIATIRQTHSHYFGIQGFDRILESLDQSILGFSNQMELDVGAKQILAVLLRKRYFGKKTISISTLRNHYCTSVMTFDSSLAQLIERGLISREHVNGPVALEVKRTNEIQGLL